MLDKFNQKAEVIAEILPHLQRYRGATIVIKYGGSAMVDKNVRFTLLRDVVLMKYVGLNPIIVHGGGPEINLMIDKLGMETKKVEGYRVTDSETMEIVEMVLSGSTNKSIVRDLNLNGGDAVGISGKDGNLLKVEKFMPNGNDIGFVGKVRKVNPKIVSDICNDGYLPVIAPIGTDEEGNSYNLNADTAAAAIAGALNADKFVMLTDVPGVMRDMNDAESLISSLTVSEARNLMHEGVISGGMIPKLDACFDAIDRGVAGCHIVDGRHPHALLLELFTDAGAGTLVLP